MKLLLFAVALACLPACDENPNAPSKLPATVEIRVGGRTAVDGTSLSITFEAMLNDSRCPGDATCIQAGDALVALVLEGDGQRVRHELNVNDTRTRRATHSRYQVEVRELRPYPFSSRPTDPATYEVSVQVTDR